MDDKNNYQLPIVVFNVVFILYQFIFNSGLFGSVFTWGKLFLAILLGAVAAGITFGAMTMMKK
jgi:hypothetical protein